MATATKMFSRFETTWFIYLFFDVCKAIEMFSRLTKISLLCVIQKFFTSATLPFSFTFVHLWFHFSFIVKFLKNVKLFNESKLKCPEIQTQNRIFLLLLQI